MPAQADQFDTCNKVEQMEDIPAVCRLTPLKSESRRANNPNNQRAQEKE